MVERIDVGVVAEDGQELRDLLDAGMTQAADEPEGGDTGSDGQGEDEGESEA